MKAIAIASLFGVLLLSVEIVLISGQFSLPTLEQQRCLSAVIANRITEFQDKCGNVNIFESGLGDVSLPRDQMVGTIVIVFPLQLTPLCNEPRCVEFYGEVYSACDLSNLGDVLLAGKTIPVI